MSIKEQTFPFSFNAGLNSKVDTFQLTANQLLQADNVRFQLDGAISKRPGFKNLSKNIIGGGQLSAGVACQAFNDELLAFDGTFIYSYVQSVDAWANRGLAISAINHQRKIISTRIAEQHNPDGTNLNGLEIYIWEDNRVNPVIEGAGIRYSVVDSQTGTFIVSDQFVYPLGVRPKALAVAPSNEILVFYEGSFNTLFSNTILTNRPQILGTIAQVISDGYSPTGYFAYDAANIVNSFNNFVPGIAYGSFNGLSLYNGTTHILDGYATDITCVALAPDSNSNTWVVYTKASGTYVTCFSSGLIEILAPTLIDASIAVNVSCIEDINKGSLNIFYELSNNSNNTNLYHTVFNVRAQTNGIITALNTQQGVGLASKPFKYNSEIFTNVVRQSKNQSTYFTLCATQQMKCIGKINPGVGGTYRTDGLLAQCDIFGSIPGNFMFANQKGGAFVSNNNTSYSLLGVNASYIDFTNVNAFNSVSATNELHIVGAVEKIYDGVSVVEDNFHLYPEVLDGTGCTIILTPSTGNLGTGQYQYVIVYEWADNGNLIERGQPSIPTIITTAADGYAAHLTIPTLSITDKSNPRSPVSIAIFRTILVSGVPSSLFFKVNTPSNPINDTTVQTVTFIDTTSDAQIQSNETLYTASQLFNSAPPACSIICPFLTRIFLSGMEDPNIIWTSQDQFALDNSNNTPIEFSPLLTQGVNPDGGRITAIREMSGNCIAFKENIIYSFGGSGPNANGTSGGFSSASVISRDTGCTNPNSIIQIPASQFYSGGLMYQSTNKGIYLLDVGQINHYIGAQVEQYNGYHITSVELINDANEVIFTTLEGTCLVYNYYFNRWSTWSYLPAVDACIWDNQLVLIQSDGTVLVQKDNYYADHRINAPDGYVPVMRTVQIPWLSFAGVQGYQQVRYAILIGHYQSPHILEMSVLYNFDPTPKEPIAINSNLVTNTFGSLPTWGSAPSFGGGPFTPYQFQYNFGFPLGESISLLITDSPLSNNDQGGIWSTLIFQVGIYQDTVRLGARNKFGGNK